MMACSFSMLASRMAGVEDGWGVERADVTMVTVSRMQTQSSPPTKRGPGGMQL